MATNISTTGAEQDTSIFGRLFMPGADYFYLLFRLIFAFIVSLHGAQKAFQLWGFPPPGSGPPDIVYIAGWVEIISALLIGFGVLTRLGAGALCVTMVIAYFMMHFGNGIAPHIFPGEGGFTAHGGEVPILWFAIAGIIGVMGSRKFGLERLILKREIL
ncbi:MAG: DoxX family protein [Chloroflexi bacterium]|nr:DoxX family protein [Chloroflexota bacterium]